MIGQGTHRGGQCELNAQPYQWQVVSKAPILELHPLFTYTRSLQILTQHLHAAQISHPFARTFLRKFFGLYACHTSRGLAQAQKSQSLMLLWVAKCCDRLAHRFPTAGGARGGGVRVAGSWTSNSRRWRTAWWLLPSRPSSRGRSSRPASGAGIPLMLR